MKILIQNLIVLSTLALGRLEKGETRLDCGMNMMQGGQILMQ